LAGMGIEEELSKWDQSCTPLFVELNFVLKFQVHIYQNVNVWVKSQCSKR